MMAVWKGARTYKGRARVLTWIFGIARNQSHNLIRKEEKARRTPDYRLASGGDDPTRSLSRDLRIQSALGALTQQQREVMHLVFYENLTVSETAHVLGIPIGTVKSRMHHARRALAKELS
jgi:RNA polymerase sigma-70 factor, ECF subfamily